MQWRGLILGVTPFLLLLCLTAADEKQKQAEIQVSVSTSEVSSDKGAAARSLLWSPGQGSFQDFLQSLFGGNWTDHVPSAWTTPEFTWDALGTFEYSSSLATFLEQLNTTKPQTLRDVEQALGALSAPFCKPEEFTHSQKVYASCSGPTVSLEYVPKMCILDEDLKLVLCDPPKLVLRRTPGGCTHKYDTPSTWKGKECKISSTVGYSKTKVLGGGSYIWPGPCAIGAPCGGEHLTCECEDPHVCEEGTCQLPVCAIGGVCNGAEQQCRCQPPNTCAADNTCQYLCGAPGESCNDTCTCPDDYPDCTPSGTCTNLCDQPGELCTDGCTCPHSTPDCLPDGSCTNLCDGAESCLGGTCSCPTSSPLCLGTGQCAPQAFLPQVNYTVQFGGYTVLTFDQAARDRFILDTQLFASRASGSPAEWFRVDIWSVIAAQGRRRLNADAVQVFAGVTGRDSTQESVQGIEQLAAEVQVDVSVQAAYSSIAAPENIVTVGEPVVGTVAVPVPVNECGAEGDVCRATCSCPATADVCQQNGRCINLCDAAGESCKDGCTCPTIGGIPYVCLDDGSCALPECTYGGVCDGTSPECRCLAPYVCQAEGPQQGTCLLGQSIDFPPVTEILPNSPTSPYNQWWLNRQFNGGTGGYVTLADEVASGAAPASLAANPPGFINAVKLYTPDPSFNDRIDFSVSFDVGSLNLPSPPPPGIFNGMLFKDFYPTAQLDYSWYRVQQTGGNKYAAPTMRIYLYSHSLQQQINLVWEPYYQPQVRLLEGITTWQADSITAALGSPAAPTLANRNCPDSTQLNQCGGWWTGPGGVKNSAAQQVTFSDGTNRALKTWGDWWMTNYAEFMTDAYVRSITVMLSINNHLGYFNQVRVVSGSYDWEWVFGSLQAPA